MAAYNPAPEPKNLPEKYEWGGYHHRQVVKNPDGTDRTDIHGVPIMEDRGYLVKNLQAQTKSHEYELLKKTPSGWGYQGNFNDASYDNVKRKVEKFQAYKHPQPTTAALRQLTKDRRTARRTKVGKKMASIRASTRAKLPPPSSSGLAPTTLSFGTGTPPSTPKVGRARSRIHMSTPPRMAGSATLAPPLPIPPSYSGPVSPHPTASTIAVPSAPPAPDPTHAREAAARARIDASIRPGGTTYTTMAHFRAHGMPRALPRITEKAGEGGGQDSYYANPTGFAPQAKSSRLWRENENQKAMSKWRMMMGWGSEIGPTKRRIY